MPNPVPMAQLSNLLLKLSRELFPDRTEREMSVSALVHPRPCDAYLLWCQPKQQVFELRAALDWQPEFVDRLAPGQQPEKHLLFQQGAYDSVEFTALFVASLLLSLGDRPGLVLRSVRGNRQQQCFCMATASAQTSPRQYAHSSTSPPASRASTSLWHYASRHDEC